MAELLLTPTAQLDREAGYIPRRKIVLIGDRGVGKSSIIQQFINNDFNLRNAYGPAVGVSNHTKLVKVPRKQAEGGGPR